MREVEIGEPNDVRDNTASIAAALGASVIITKFDVAPFTIDPDYLDRLSLRVADRLSIPPGIKDSQEEAEANEAR